MAGRLPDPATAVPDPVPLSSLLSPVPSCQIRRRRCARQWPAFGAAAAEHGCTARRLAARRWHPAGVRGGSGGARLGGGGARLSAAEARGWRGLGSTAATAVGGDCCFF